MFVRGPLARWTLTGQGILFLRLDVITCVDLRSLIALFLDVLRLENAVSACCPRGIFVNVLGLGGSTILPLYVRRERRADTTTRRKIEVIHILVAHQTSPVFVTITREHFINICILFPSYLARKRPAHNSNRDESANEITHPYMHVTHFERSKRRVLRE